MKIENTCHAVVVETVTYLNFEIYISYKVFYKLALWPKFYRLAYLA